MASPALCLYCFEVLSASLERRDPPTLQKVLESYENYKTATTTSDELASEDADPVDPVEDAEAGKQPEEEETNTDEEYEEADIERIERRQANNKAGLQIPSISRLQASSSSSRSSSKSSPSVLSADSSNSLSTAASSISTRPSYASRLSITESYPLFVTWNVLSRSGHKSLRGCIGTFEALPLASGLSTYALTSAFEDTRFSPIPASALPTLSCGITLLADFEPCKNAMDWTLGQHGLRISFNYRNRRHGATYLPDVAVEQGWTKEETVESLMKKAGWDGGYGGSHGVARRLLRRGPTASEQQGSSAPKPWDEVQDFRTIRYTGLTSSATYAEWQEWRAWSDKSKVK
jgi:AMME syndrome candidate gene 1 protein